MTAKEAYKILLDKVPGANVRACVEFNSMFMFEILPKDHTESIGKVHLDCQSFVRKDTGEFGRFDPRDLSRDEYFSGKVVENFK